MKVSVSFITSNYKEELTIKKIEETDADYIHVDLMDGKFVENKNYTFSEIVKYLGNAKKKLDVHLMVSNPSKYIEQYATLNTEYLTFHYEAVTDPKSVITEIKSYGLKVGMSIKPSTSVDKVAHLLCQLDQILVMSVEPGAGGQEFMYEVVPKLQDLDAIRKQNNCTYIISVDGGIIVDKVELLKANHVDLVVSGSYICKSDDYQGQIDKLRK